MGCWDIFCSLCGLPLNTGERNNINIPKWMYKCTLLLNNNKNIHNAQEVACNINFYANKKEYNSLLNYPKSFIVIHTDCWKYIKKEKNIKLRYSDFPIIDKLYNTKNYALFNFNLDYKPISNYWEQSFNIEKYINDGYLLVSPLKGNKVLSKFIINIFNRLNIKLDRSGPRVSASLYKNNDLLIGTDDNIWKINNKKWIKTNNLGNFIFSSNIKVTNKNIDLLTNIYNYFEYKYCNENYKKNKLFYIPRLGTVSNCGMILKDIKIKLTNKLCKIKFSILYNDKGVDELNKMIKNNFGLL
jgi:hypothetical protein